MSKGDILLRLDPEARQRLEEASREEGVPMAQIIREGLDLRLANGHRSSSEARKAALLEVAETARRLANGDVLVPAAEVPADSWHDLMSREDNE